MLRPFVMRAGSLFFLNTGRWQQPASMCDGRNLWPSVTAQTSVITRFLCSLTHVGLFPRRDDHELTA